MIGPSMASLEGQQPASISRQLAEAGQVAGERLYSFRVYYVAIFAFLLLYLFTVRMPESALDAPFQPIVDGAVIVTDLDQCVTALQAGGHEVERDGSMPDRRRAFTADPFGNRLELIQMGDGFLQRPHDPQAPASDATDAPPRIDQAITFLYTTDIGPMAHFYETVIGLPLVLDQGGCRIYRVAGEAFLGVCQRPQPRNPEGLIVTFVADDVDAWAERLRAHGVALEKEPAYNPDYRIHHLFARDPGGYLVEIQRFEDERWPRPIPSLFNSVISSPNFNVSGLTLSSLFFKRSKLIAIGAYSAR